MCQALEEVKLEHSYHKFLLVRPFGENDKIQLCIILVKVNTFYFVLEINVIFSLWEVKHDA